MLSLYGLSLYFKHLLGSYHKMNMRYLFPGYYQPTEEEFTELWKECIFSFDTNVLLHIYRYSPKTRQRLFDILEKLQERQFLIFL